MILKDYIEKAGYYFNLKPDMENEKEIIEQISNGVTFKGANLWVLIFAIFIASLGLNVNSTAVIIGAMLISPLMGPIIGMGLAVGINDVELLKRSSKNFAVATLISVMTATFYFLITPLNDVQSELLARTSPTLYDVLIAFCGGAAGIIALCTRGKGNVIPGVAIATALMPPLCTAGFGLATGHILFFLGAFYLFFINTVFIALATYFGVRLMNFKRHEFQSAESAIKARRYLTGIVVITMIPALLMTINIVKKSIFENNMRNFIQTEITQRGTQIISNDIDRDSMKLNIVAIGKEITEEKRKEAERRMEQYGMEGYQLRIIQGTQSDSLLMYGQKLNTLTTTSKNEHQKLLQVSAENTILNEQLSKYSELEKLSAELRPEMATLFPMISKFSLTRIVEVNRDSTATIGYVAFFIHETDRKQTSKIDKKKLRDWLQTRIKTDSLVVVSSNYK